MFWDIIYYITKHTLRMIFLIVVVYFAFFLILLLIKSGGPFNPAVATATALQVETFLASLNPLVLDKSWPALATFLAINILSDVIWLAPDKLLNISFGFLAKLAPVHGVLLHQMRNTSTIELSKLDEFIKHIYHTSSGNIYLFNPPIELFDTANQDFKDIQNALRANARNIDSIIVKVPDAAQFQNMPLLVDADLKDKIRVRQLNGAELETAKHVRAAGYSVRPLWKSPNNKKAGSNLRYFLYRPISAPYGDQCVVIKRADALKKINLTGSEMSNETLYVAVCNFCGVKPATESA